MRTSVAAAKDDDMVHRYVELFPWLGDDVTLIEFYHARAAKPWATR